MTAEEIMAEVRLLASDMAIRGACPGEVSPSLQYRITDFLHRAGTPFAPWRDHRKYLTKTRTAICDGKEVPCQVHKAVVDDTAGELCREIAQSLLVSKWMLLPESKDWTADRAELAIKDAVARLPGLCDKLEATERLNSTPPADPSSGVMSVEQQAATLADGDAAGIVEKTPGKASKPVELFGDGRKPQRCQILAYYASRYAEMKRERQLSAKEAYGYWEQDGFDPADKHTENAAELAGYELPDSFETFKTQLSKGRSAFNDRRYENRKGRQGRSIVRGDEID